MLWNVPCQALHNVTATITWDIAGTDMPDPAAAPEAITKTIGFRSATLYTGPPAPQQPAPVDPQHAADFVGCYRDGNPYWGGPQHALPFKAGNQPNMTVGHCIALCAAAGKQYTLAGLQPSPMSNAVKPTQSTVCYCGETIGATCTGCLPLTGTLGDPTECGWPCGGNPSVACGGMSYMWGSNSVYNVSSATTEQDAAIVAAAAAAPPPPPPGTEGSGNTAFAVVVNGVKVFARGGNLVPFELLEATALHGYIRRTVQSARAGNMNMLRVWGGGIYQDDLFYAECDRLGIMIYQDMMFCERFYPHDAGFVADVKKELQYQVGRLRHHPSIVLWDSSNENEGDPAFYYNVVLATVADADGGSRPLWPASPSSGFATGVHTATGLYQAFVPQYFRFAYHIPCI